LYGEKDEINEYCDKYISNLGKVASKYFDKNIRFILCKVNNKAIIKTNLSTSELSLSFDIFGRLAPGYTSQHELNIAGGMDKNIYDELQNNKTKKFLIARQSFGEKHYSMYTPSVCFSQEDDRFNLLHNYFDFNLMESVIEYIRSQFKE